MNIPGHVDALRKISTVGGGGNSETGKLAAILPPWEKPPIWTGPILFQWAEQQGVFLGKLNRRTNWIFWKEIKKMQSNFKTAYTLTAIIALLTIFASAGGLLIEDLYQDNLQLTAGWFGNDLVTSFVAVPLLVGAMIFSMRGSLRAQLVWLGMLDYTLYNFAFYLFGSAFNAFFMLYVALLTLSIIALIYGLVALDVERFSQGFRSRTPVQWIGGYMLFLAL